MPTYPVRPTIDTVLQQQTPNSNGNAAGLFTGIIAAGKALRSILHFDLAAMPPYVTIDAVSLTINCVSTSALIDIEASVHRLTQPAWSETQATWNNYATALPWGAPGGDYAGDPVQWYQPTQNGYVVITGTDGFGYISMRALVLDAIALRSSQLHIILKQFDETFFAYLYQYTDREFDPYTPLLQITYTAPAPPRGIGRRPRRNRGMIDTPARPSRAAAADSPGGAARAPAHPTRPR